MTCCGDRYRLIGRCPDVSAHIYHRSTPVVLCQSAHPTGRCAAAGGTAGISTEALLCRCRVAVLTQRLVAALHADCWHSMPAGLALQLIGVLQVGGYSSNC